MCFLPFLLLAYDYNFPASLHHSQHFLFFFFWFSYLVLTKLAFFSFLRYFEQRAHGGRPAFLLLVSRSVPKETFLVPKRNGFDTVGVDLLPGGA